VSIVIYSHTLFSPTADSGEWIYDGDFRLIRFMLPVLVMQMVATWDCICLLSSHCICDNTRNHLIHNVTAPIVVSVHHKEQQAGVLEHIPIYCNRSRSCW